MEKDVVGAFVWYSIAADNGHIGAAERRTIAIDISNPKDGPIPKRTR